MKYICRIGNNAQNDLVIIDRTAADFHAHLIMDNEDRVWIKDLSTKYGTRVNGVKVTKSELNYSDEIRIGFTIIDWIGIRNKWQEGQAAHIETNAWSEPLKQTSKNDGIRSEISQELANEAVKSNKEYNPNEFSSGNNIESRQSSDIDIPMKKSEELEIIPLEPDESSSELEIAPNEEHTSQEISEIESLDVIETEESKDDPQELKTASNEEFIHPEVNAIEDSERILDCISDEKLKATVQIAEENIELIPTDTTISEIKNEGINGIEAIENRTNHSSSFENFNENTTNHKHKVDAHNEQEIQDDSIIKPKEIAEHKPIAIPTSTGIRFDYRGSSENKKNKPQEPIVRIVAKTSVSNVETQELKPILTADQRLVLGVIALVFSMLLIGWLLASLGN